MPRRGSTDPRRPTRLVYVDLPGPWPHHGSGFRPARCGTPGRLFFSWSTSKADHFLVGGLPADIEQCFAHDLVDVLVDPRGVSALDHCDGRIVKRGNNADRYSSGELARDA